MANDNQNNDFRLLVEIIRTLRKESGCAHDVYKSLHRITYQTTFMVHGCRGKTT